ncbi:MAG: GNAT family protein [Bacteroidales bacterium]
MKNFPVLQTDRLELVEIKDSHLRDIQDLFGDKKVTRFYNLLPFENEQDAQKFIDWYHIRFKDGLAFRWGISLKGENKIIGTIGFNNFTKKHRANIGYDLKPEYWNHGYITEALKEVIDFGFNQLKINRIEAEVMQGNGSSERVLNKLNFKKEGVLRQWMFWNKKYYDMSMFALLRIEYEKN